MGKRERERWTVTVAFPQKSRLLFASEALMEAACTFWRAFARKPGGKCPAQKGQIPTGLPRSNP